MPHSNTENYPVVIFLPLYELYEDGYLYGEVNTDPLLQTTNFFIHEATGNALRPNNLHSIGFIGDAHLSNNMISKKKNWLHLKFDNKTPYVVKLINYHLEIKEMDYQIILYDKYRFLKSELLLSDSDIESGDDNIIDDHFKRLTYSLKHLEVLSKTKDDFPTVIKLVFTTFLFCLKILDNALSWSPTLLKYSSLVNHAAMFVKSMIWGLEITMQKKKLKSLKTGNYISSVIGDWISGLLLLFWLLSVITIKDMLQTLAEHSEVVVVSLRDTVTYLMGSPADLKLNGPLNNVLGRFYLFHIDLWWAFLGYSRPLLEFGFYLFLCLGSLGLSFQLAILADLLAIATFHIYIIYIYAAKLYHAQIIGLGTLARVFFGRKSNPLPGRVDSCPYTTEQLFISTIAFTVLLFLLPTTMVYYIVFTLMRLLLIGVSGLVTQASLLARALPLYSTVLWLCNSPTTTSCVRLTPRPGQCVIEACPVQGPWPTVRGTPSPPTPSTVPWRELCCHVLTGTLLYPV